MTITAEELKAQRDNAEQGEFMADGCSLDIDTSEGGLAECAVFVFPETASYAASVMQAHITGQLVHVDEVERLRQHITMMKEAISLVMSNHTAADDSPNGGYIDDDDGSLMDTMSLAHCGPARAALGNSQSDKPAPNDAAPNYPHIEGVDPWG